LSYIAEWGLLGLGLIAFLAATLVPLSSEAAVAGALSLDYNPLAVLLVASIGNGLACLVNYGIGYLVAPWTQDKLQQSKSGRWALTFSHNYRYLALALSWMPIIGDPITLAAGLIRMSWWRFLLIVIPLRIARYVAIIWIMNTYASSTGI
jgi:membrane protein YqaA with SNARE-associated domain